MVEASDSQQVVDSVSEHSPAGDVLSRVHDSPNYFSERHLLKASVDQNKNVSKQRKCERVSCVQKCRKTRRYWAFVKNI